MQRLNGRAGERRYIHRVARDWVGNPVFTSGARHSDQSSVGCDAVQVFPVVVVVNITSVHDCMLCVACIASAVAVVSDMPYSDPTWPSARIYHGRHATGCALLLLAIGTTSYG